MSCSAARFRNINYMELIMVVQLDREPERKSTAMHATQHMFHVMTVS